MLNLLIVDDEEMIVDWLIDLFKEKRSEQLEILHAYNGVEALSVMQNHKVDILLSDIRMPQIDGLQLMEQVKRRWPSCNIVFLTGFNEFDYIYKAIKQDNVGYILKTEEDESIINAVDDAIKRIVAEHDNKLLIQKAEKYMEIAQPLLHQEYFQSLIFNKMPEINLILNQLNDINIEISIDKKVLLIYGRTEDRKYLSPQIPKKHFTIQAILDEYLSQLVSINYVILDQKTFAIIIQNSTTDLTDDELINFILYTLDDIQKEYEKLLEHSISFVIAQQFIEWEKLPQKYQQLKSVLFLNNDLETGVITFANDRNSIVATNNSNDWTNSIIDRLMKYLQTGEIEQWLKEYNMILKNLSQNQSKDIEYYYKIAIGISTFGNDIRYWQHINNDIKRNNLMNIAMHENIKKAFLYLENIMKSIYFFQTEKISKNNNDTIEFIKDYILKNIDGDLSIIKLSSILHYNSSYLSRLFRQKAGMSISDYIKELKIKKACEYLANTNTKIGEISKALGFSAPSYFNRFFKKHKEVSPNEFRHNVHNI